VTEYDLTANNRTSSDIMVQYDAHNYTNHSLCILIDSYRLRSFDQPSVSSDYTQAYRRVQQVPNEVDECAYSLRIPTKPVATRACLHWSVLVKFPKRCYINCIQLQ